MERDPGAFNDSDPFSTRGGMRLGVTVALLVLARNHPLAAQLHRTEVES